MINYEDLNIEEIIDWLADHKTAYADAMNHFGVSDLDYVDQEDLIDWIYDHDQLAGDFENFFNADIDLDHAEEWAERHPYGYYNDEDDYGVDGYDESLNESSCFYMDLDDEEFDIVDELIDFYKDYKCITNLSDIPEDAKYQFTDSKNRDYYTTFKTVYVLDNSELNEEANEQEKISVLNSTDNKFEDAWNTLDIDMTAKPMSVEDFNSIMDDIRSLKW